MDTDLNQAHRPNVVRAGDVATTEYCHGCPHCKTCIRHAPKFCNRTNTKARKRVSRNNARRIAYLSREEIEILSVIEIGFVTFVPCVGRKVENSL